MSSVTAVPLRPVSRSALITLWVGIGLLAAVGLTAAFYGTRSQVAMAMPATDYMASNGKRSGIVTTSSGLQYEVLREGSGPKPGPNDVVLVEYDGRLVNGQSFDSSKVQGGPAALPVAGGMIPGWGEGLQLMKQGSKYRFYIPPQLGFGERGAGGKIPPNAVTVFEVDLLAIAPPQAMGGMGGGMGGMGGMPEGHGDMGMPH